MAHYVLQTIAFQLVFLLAYDMFLKKETFFKWNRIYLLVTTMLSLILPFIKVEGFKKVVPQNYIMSLPDVIIGSSLVNNTVTLNTVVLEQNPMSFWEIIFYTGLCIAFCLFLYKVFKILVLVIKNPKQSIGTIVLVELLNSNAAFSFFHYIFLGEWINAEDREAILKHELIHTKQKHTLDLLFFEMLRIVFWFNPFVYMYQNRMATLHEFIADANAVKHQNKEQYYQNLLSQVFETKNISFINTFFKQSLIKKRIVMLSKTKSKQVHLFKYALLIPLVFGMLMYTSAEAQDEQGDAQADFQELTDKQLKAKFSNELKEMESNGASFSEISNAHKPLGNLYVMSKGAYYKQQAFLKYMVHKSGTSKVNSSGALNRSYSDYLEWKKTDEAKEIWENNTHDGVLKLVVNDLDNLTSEENKKYNKKKELLSKDVFFTKLLMTDINGDEIKMLIQPNEYALANKRDESKAVLLNEVDINVGYDVIDRVPGFPGCESLTNNELKKCTTEEITKYVSENFNTKLANELNLKGRQRINVVFKIDTEGNVKEVKSRAPHPDLEAEAIRVVMSLPKMIPGKHKGKNVVVPYSLPIIFQINEKPENEETELIPLDDVEVPFAVIENVPVYPGCEDLSSNIEKKTCMSEKITKFVVENFNTKIANQNGLSGRQRINVIFKIDTEGNIKGVRSRAPHPALEAEAMRVISSLPKMKPGIQKGKPVTVPYSLPIIFEIEEKTKQLDEIIVNDDSNASIEVPFALVEEPPIFPGCESLNKKEQKTCFANEVTNYVSKKINTKLAKELGLIGQQRINVIFKIDTDGNIKGVRSRAPHPDLEVEAKRVIKRLPKMIPGKHKGKNVKVVYSLPIIFQVDE